MLDIALDTTYHLVCQQQMLDSASLRAAMDTLIQSLALQYQQIFDMPSVTSTIRRDML